MPLGPAQQYIVTFNNSELPGYAQSEDDPTEMNLSDHYAFGWDGSQTQIAGLSNKSFRMDFKVWEDTYRACKDQYHLATSILRSRRDGFAPLFVDYTDRYFNAITKSVSYQQNVSQSRKLLTYSVEFECQPWMIGTTPHVLSGGAGTIVTTGRTLADGGWTPALLSVTGGSNIPQDFLTVSGYTATESFTGFISVSGIVSNFEINTEAATTDGDFRMAWKDYGVWVGPGETTFVTQGVTSYTLTYLDRWY